MYGIPMEITSAKPRVWGYSTILKFPTTNNVIPTLKMVWNVNTSKYKQKRIQKKFTHFLKIIQIIKPIQLRKRLNYMLFHCLYKNNFQIWRHRQFLTVTPSPSPYTERVVILRLYTCIFTMDRFHFSIGHLRLERISTFRDFVSS